ncbi:m73.5 protein [Murid betaherpesvirus 1]|nr:m73.5 protein [Murid betaherpesvirus 1]AWV68325.1 m73.5 protein [Murid betaherpesvirus 1]
MACGKTESGDDSGRFGRTGSGSLCGARCCYAAIVNTVIMVAMMLVLYRAIIGFQDDIVLRSTEAFRRMWAGKSNATVCGGCSTQ